MNKSKILDIRRFKLTTCKEWELVVPRFSLLTIVHVTLPRQQNFPQHVFCLLFHPLLIFNWSNKQSDSTEYVAG